jgi:hypothetical protein
MTAKKRLKIYKDILLEIRNDIKTAPVGFCYYTHQVTGYTVNASDLPELMAFKPKEMFNEWYWFNLEPRSGMRKRINILKKIIAEMEKNPENL